VARLYANENFPLPAVVELRRLGHDVLTIQETGRDNAAVSDAGVLAFAAADKRAVLTLNRRHFIRLHAGMPGHAGIVVCSVDTDFEALAQRVHAVLAATRVQDGELVRVNRAM
jgi:Domain of unknown function (DUF5615)